MNLKKQLVAFVLAVIALVLPVLTVPASADETTTVTETETVQVAIDVNIDPRCYNYEIVVCASKEDRKVRFMKDGVVIKKFDARFGRPGLETRNGNWTVYGKDADAWSNLYNVPLPYSLKFSRGQYIHFSKEFSEKGYGYPYGSHGCINIRSMSQAKWLFNRVPVGTHVIVS